MDLVFGIIKINKGNSHETKTNKILFKSHRPN